MGAIDPVALRFGGFEIRWYGIIMATAVAIGTYLAYREAQRKGVNPEHILNIVIIGAPLSWIGARIYYVIFQWEYYAKHLEEIVRIWHGGLAFHGGIITALIVGLLYTRWQRLKFWLMADIFAPSLILGQAIGRVGNFTNQEAYGYVTNVPWAIYMAGAPRHPTFFYESLWNIAVFMFLLWFRRRPGRVDGDIFLAYIALYSVGRFVIEGFRTDSLMLGPFRVAQIVSIAAILIAGFLFYYYRERRSAKR